MAARQSAALLDHRNTDASHAGRRDGLDPATGVPDGPVPAGKPACSESEITSALGPSRRWPTRPKDMVIDVRPPRPGR
jgi:hypothetical protein